MLKLELATNGNSLELWQLMLNHKLAIYVNKTSLWIFCYCLSVLCSDDINTLHFCIHLIPLSLLTIEKSLVSYDKKRGN